MSGDTQLTPRQRYQIERYRNEDQLSQAEIARRLGIHRSRHPRGGSPSRDCPIRETGGVDQPVFHSSGSRKKACAGPRPIERRAIPSGVHRAAGRDIKRTGSARTA